MVLKNFERSHLRENIQHCWVDRSYCASRSRIKVEICVEKSHSIIRIQSMKQALKASCLSRNCEWSNIPNQIIEEDGKKRHPILLAILIPALQVGNLPEYRNGNYQRGHLPVVLKQCFIS